MPLPVDNTEVLNELLTERDTQLQEKKLPQINIGLAIPIKEDLTAGIDYSLYGITDVIGATDDGIIGTKTTSIVTIGDDIEFAKSPVADWAKGATWTQLELDRVTQLGMNLETKKLDALYANGMATIQRAGYIGHKQVKGQTGLLNESNVSVYNETTGKTIADMTAEEVVGFIVAVYNLAWKASEYSVAPDTIAMDAEDFMALCQKFDASSAIVGVDLMPISALQKLRAALNSAQQNFNGEEINVTFVKVPSKMARDITKNKTRLVCYINDEDYVNMSVEMPVLLPAQPKGLLGYEAGYIARFSGAKWIEPKSAYYGDYKSSAN